MAKNPVLNVCMECDYPRGSCDNEAQHSLIALAKTYGDHFFVTTPDLLDFFPTAEHLPFIHPVEVNFDEIPPLPRPDGVFRIVTSSNHEALDGVAHIRGAVDRLRSEGHAVELIEIFQQPYREAIAAYKSADLYVGKLLMGYYNNANIETMMLGVPNMCHIREEFRPMMADAPIIVTQPSTVYDNLKEWLGKQGELKSLGARGPDFVHRHHDPDVLVDRIIDRYRAIIEAKST